MRVDCIAGGEVDQIWFDDNSLGADVDPKSRKPVVDLIWLPPRDSNPDMLIQSPKEASDSKQFQQDSSAKPGKSRQNPQTIRKQDPGFERSD